MSVTAFMKQRILRGERLGRIDYGAALDLQKQTERAVLTGEQPDTLLLLEHPHTLTRGRRATEGGIVAPDQVLRERGVAGFETNRGGKLNYNGAGPKNRYSNIYFEPRRARGARLA